MDSIKSIKIVEYKEEFGRFTLPDGMADYLRGLSLEKQVEFFAVKFYSLGPATIWSLDECPEYYCKGLIVKDGIIIGMLMPNYRGDLYPTYVGEEQFVGSEDCDNNGAGYKTIDFYLEMVFVPDDELLRTLQKNEG